MKQNKSADKTGSPRRKKKAINGISSFYQNFNVPGPFPKSVLKEVNNVSPKIEKDRLDCRHLNAFTIDPDDARDYDDALSVEQNEDGSWTAGVHIADVSFWVPAGSRTDQEARNRGNSYYFPWGSVPMLPENLTTDICSLVPDQDRRAVSCFFTMRGNRIVETSLAKTMIRSRRRLTYRDAQKLLDGATPQSRDWLRKSLFMLRQAGLELRKKREARGGLNFEIPEYGISFTGNEPTSFHIKTIQETNRMVEDWMLETNETVARVLVKKQVPALFRNHGSPGADEQQELYQICRALRCELSGNTPSARFKSAISRFSGHPAASVFYRLLLRTMMKARYEPRSRGHFGIGASRYTHFTSPIRRYPDLVVHRALKKALGLEVSLQSGKKKMDKNLTQRLRAVGDHCTETEVNAERAERDAVKWLACRWMTSKLNEKYDAVISGITRFGIFAELKDMPVEGLILRRDMRDDVYQFDEDRLMVTGRYSKKTYRMGDSIRVVLKKSNPAMLQMDFLLAE